MACELIDTIPVGNTLGEGVLWDDIGQKVWWTDIEENILFSYDLVSKNLLDYSLPERLCSFAFVENSTCFLAAFETGLAYFEPLTGEVVWIKKIFKKGCGLRLNDGRVDHQGRFWVGAMDENLKQTNTLNSAVNLYQYSSSLGLSVHETDIEISNSLSWSLDGRVLYFADSPKNSIFAYDFKQENGQLSNRRLFASTPAAIHPDGSCTDSEGCLWNAQWGSNQIVRYSPTGQIDYTLTVPSHQPTCVSFGGENLDMLIVTSAKLDMTSADRSEYPESGNVFVYQTKFKGQKERRFRLNN